MCTPDLAGARTQPPAAGSQLSVKSDWERGTGDWSPSCQLRAGRSQLSDIEVHEVVGTGLVVPDAIVVAPLEDVGPIAAGRRGSVFQDLLRG